MIKTVKVIRTGKCEDDYSWALSMTDDERIELATRLTRDLWCAAHGTTFPAMNRSLTRLLKTA